MTSPFNREALGDWSGIKATEYHILYAIWLLLCKGASQVSFYAGNDLLASPISPPIPQDIGETAVDISIHSVSGEIDVWIQLKSTEDPWTLARILPKPKANSRQENLIKNFICNAVLSEQNGRSWQAQLLTQGVIKAKEIQDFLANPEDPYFTRLNEEIQRAKDEIQNLNPKPNLTAEKLRTIALEVLRQLTMATPKSFETLKSQTEKEIALACFNRERTYQIANTLRGALLEDAARGPAAARSYDVSWLNEKAGWPLKSAALFDQNPVAACEKAIEQVLPSGWNEDHFIHREHFETALQLFLKAPETLFVLVGPSGRGKSWIAADVALRILEGRMRLLVPGHTLMDDVDLTRIVAKSFRRFTSDADWTDEQLFRRTIAAPKAKGDNPLVIIIDDLVPPTIGTEIFIKNVVTLVDDCRRNGIKLITTCQQQVWELYRFADSIPASQLFLTERGFSSERFSDVKRSTYSLLLDDLTPDELTEAIKRRLPNTAPESASFLLRADQFSVLRNPYLLGRYLDQHAISLSVGTDNPIPADVNDVLDNRVTGALRRVATSLSLSEDDLRPALDLLVTCLWPKRVEGLPRGVATQVLKSILNEQTSSFLAEMRKTGLVSATGNVNFTEGALADRLYAKHLVALQDNSALAELQPESDFGVVIALMRGLVSDPVLFAEQLLMRDRRWIRAVSDGLAQSTKADHRMIAMLAGLLRSDPRHWILSEVGDAFGQLASRDERAWKTATRIYFSNDTSEHACGEYILSAAMEFVPERVVAAVRLRISRAGKVRGFFQNEKKKRSRIIKGALEPFRGINHRRAAELTERLFKRFDRLSKRLEDDEKYAFFEDVDRARGRIALHTNISELKKLSSELKSDDHVARYRAACALRAVVFDQPHIVKDALCEALLRPNEYGTTLNRILLACYPLISADPELLLRTLKASTLTDWKIPTHTAGQVLGLLGDLAANFTNEVHPLLPDQLTAFHPEWRAFLSEMHAYAWWRCAEKLPEAAEHLSLLNTPDLTGVPHEFIPFAYRGAVIAQLGATCVGHVSAESLAGNHIFYPLWDLEFAYVNTRSFIRQRAKFILAQAGYEHLQELLVKCVTEEDRVRVHPANEQLCQSQFRAATLCVEILTEVANNADDPLKALLLLPRDWQALQMSRELLEIGHAEPEFIDFVDKLCEERSHGAKSFQAAHERNRCLALLAARKENPETALTSYNKDAMGGLFTSTARADGLARLVDSHPTDLLSLLDLSIRDGHDISTLYFWHNESTSWRGWLLSWVYKRMFDLRPIRTIEAKELCQMALTAVETLPDSTEKAEYMMVYQTIRGWLNGDLAIPDFDIEENSKPIHQAHVATLSLFRQASELIKNADNKWLRLSLSDSRGWIDSEYEFNDGELSLVSQWYRNYVFPSLRLAFVAIGSHYNLLDPAAETLGQRRQVKELIDRFPDIFRETATCDSIDDYKRSRIEKALKLFEEQLVRTPYDEHLVASYGGLLLRLGRFVEANQTLRDCLELPGCTGDSLASVFYDLACVQSRLGNDADCQRFLENSAALRPLDIKHTAEDADLAGVRERDWFKHMVKPQSDGSPEPNA